jgi:hypothetical protein
MTTRAEATAPPALTPADFLYLTDGPRQGDTILAPGHTGKIVLGFAPNVPPRLGSELLYQPTKVRTADGARCYEYVPPGVVPTLLGDGLRRD